MPPKQRTEKQPNPPADPTHPPGTRQPETQPSEERGERIDTGKTIARGGREDGDVPGAEPDE